MRRLFAAALFISLIALLLAPFSVFAQEADFSTSDPATVDEVNSFELFWPIVAGKTTGDPLYFLKSLKEKVRGWFIFGVPQKAEYAVFLATKRVIEAEKLINEGKTDLTNKSLDAAIKQLDKAEENVQKARGKEIPFQEEAVNMGSKLSGLETLIPWLANKSEENKDKLEQTLDRVKSVYSKI